MGKKEKCTSCSAGWCKNHLFQLTPTDSHAYFRKKIKLRFCPKIAKSKSSFEKILPLLNQDLKFYTPCFILEEEKKYYSDNDEKLVMSHHQKIQLEGNVSETILVAKHGRKKNYCSVCKSQYEDYMSHLEDANHKKNLRANKFTSYIADLQIHVQKQKPVIDIAREIIPEVKIIEETQDVEKDITFKKKQEKDDEKVIEHEIDIEMEEPDNESSIHPGGKFSE